MYLFRSCGVGTIPQFLQRQCPTRGSRSSSVTSAWTTFVLEQQQRRRTSLHQPGKIKLFCPTPLALRSLSFFDQLRLQVLFFVTGSGSFSYKNRLKSGFCLHIFTPAPSPAPAPAPTKKYRLRPAPAPQHCTPSRTTFDLDRDLE